MKNFRYRKIKFGIAVKKIISDTLNNHKIILSLIYNVSRKGKTKKNNWSSLCFYVSGTKYMQQAKEHKNK